jgi:fibronectin type 3 domain-containing protein
MKRSLNPDGPYATIATGIVGTTYVNGSLANGTRYYYRVSAMTAGGETPDSNTASAVPYGPLPGAPTGLTATATSSDISLRWNAGSYGGYYRVMRATTAGGPYTVIRDGLTTTEYRDTGLQRGTTYFYVVTSVNPQGESPPSNEASGSLN